jgi:hypothetical protein
VAVGNFGQEAFPDRSASAEAGHIGFGPGFVDENQTSRRSRRLLAFPVLAFLSDIGPVLLGGMNRLFLKDRRNRESAMPTADSLQRLIPMR